MIRSLAVALCISALASLSICGPVPASSTCDTRSPQPIFTAVDDNSGSNPTTYFPIPGSNPPLKLQFVSGTQSSISSDLARQVLDAAISRIESYMPFESGDPVPSCWNSPKVDGKYSLYIGQVPTYFQPRFTWLVAQQAVKGYKSYIGNDDPVPFQFVRIYANDATRFLYGIMQLSND